jgi:putative tricarboxylic transport membrane protein
VGGKKGDPHFLLTAVTSFLTTPILRKSQITPKDFTPIANFAFDEYMVIVKAGGKYKSMKDIVDAAKANPKQLTVGGTQLGSSDSVCAYLIEKAAGIQFNFIVFNSGGEVNAALMGGHIDLAVSNPGEALELAKAGRVQTLGVFAEKRLPGAPNVPTLKEQGIDAIYVQNRGLVAPAGIPEDARKVVEDALLKYTKTKTYKDYIAEGMLSEAWMDGPTFGKWMEKEYARYQVMLKDMGLVK